MPLFAELVFDIALWNAALAAVLAACALALYRRTVPPVSTVRRFGLALLRIIGFGLLLLFVLNPVSVSIKSEVRTPLVAVLFDVSRSMSVADESGASRRDAAVEGLRRFSASMSVAGDADIEVVCFAADLAAGPVAPDSILDAAGEGTDIAGAVATALMRYRSRNLTGIVLLTDGRATRGMSGAQMNIGVPVFAVGYGDTLRGADIAIERVRYERTAYVGTAAAVEAIIRASGFAGEDIRVRLEDNGKPIESGEIHVRDGSAEFAVTLDFVPEAAGMKDLTVRALTPSRDERKENDSEAIRIRVLKENLRVAYIDRHADWNATFIMDLAERSPRFTVEAITRVPEIGIVSLPDRRPWSVPATPEEFERYDLIIIADENGEIIDADRIGALDAYIAAGGGLLLLADEHTPLVYPRIARLYEPLLPLALRGPVRIETGEFSVSPSSEHHAQAIAAPFIEHGRSFEIPPLPGRLTGVAVTAGAEVPLVLFGDGEPSPFCAVQRRGHGVSAAVLAFPIWRWRLAGEEGRALYQAFVGGLIQYLAEGIDSPPYEVMADRSVYRTGDRLGFTVYARESRFVERLRGEVSRTAGDGEAIVRTFLFEPEPRRESYFRAVLDPLPPGEYRIAVYDVRASGTELAGQAVVTVEPTSVEFLDVSRDAAFLRDLADRSGGAVIDPDDIESLPDRISFANDRVTRRLVHPLRRNPWFFISILAAFAAEWLLRKAWGLV